MRSDFLIKKVAANDMSSAATWFECHLRVLENQSTEMVVRVQAISISQQDFMFMPNEIPH